MDQKNKKKFFQTFLRFTWHSLPFIMVILAIVLVIFPLGRKITAKKTALAQQQSRQIKENKELVNVVTLELIPGMVMEKITLPGVVKPWISLEIVSEVRGKIMEKKIDQGIQVKNNDILALIDKRDYQNYFDSAMASYETALINEKRFFTLSKKQFVTTSQLDDAQARVKTTRAAMENARLNLDRCTIRSPMEGMVERTYIENGSFLAVGDPVARILKMDILKIQVGIPESDVDAVRKLKTFDIVIDALGKKIFQGQFHYLYKTSDSMARLYNLEIKVENPGFQILPDMFARVSIVKQQDPQGLAVPIFALVSVDQKTGVFVEKHGIAEFRPITTGFQDGWRTQIPKGLVPGDRVIVVGHKIIEHGEKVNVIQTVRDMEELNQ